MFRLFSEAFAGTGIVPKLASGVTFAGSSGAIYGWWRLNEWCAIIGATCAVIGLIVNIYFKVKEK